MAFRGFESLSAGLTAYVTLCRRLLMRPLLPLHMQKVVVFQWGRTGMADHLTGLASSLLLALATQRPLLVKPSDVIDVPKILQNPGWDWLIPLEELDGFARLDNYTSAAMGPNGTAPLGPRLPGKANLTGYSKVYRRREGFGTAIDMELSWKVMLDQQASHELLCSDLRTGPIGDANVLLTGTEWWGPLLLSNPHHASDVLGTLNGGRAEGLFAAIVAFLLRPSLEVQSRIDAFKKAHFVDSPPQVSMHIRRGHSRMDETKKTNGLVKHGLEGGWYGVQDAAFLQCAERHRLVPKGSTVFVASDDMRAQKRVEKVLMKRGARRVIWTDKKYNATTGRLANTNEEQDWVKTGSYTTSSSIEAMVDYWLLGEAKTMLVSTMSSVACFAPGRAVRKPWVVTIEGDCVFVPRSEPCLHLLSQDYRTRMHGAERDVMFPCAGLPQHQNLGKGTPSRKIAQAVRLHVRRNTTFYHSNDSGDRYRYTCLIYDTGNPPVSHQRRSTDEEDYDDEL